MLKNAHGSENKGWILMFFHRSCCSVLAVLLFSSTLLLGMSSCSDTRDDVVRPQVRKSDESVAEGPNVREEDERIFLTLPFIEPEGAPIAAILDDTNHFVDDWGPLFPNKPIDYRQGIEPIFALWPNGKVIWRTDDRQYYRSRIGTGAVKELLSSIRIEDYNTTDNMRYSYSGGELVEESFMILYVSMGTGDNIILYSPFHQWKTQKIYTYWDQSGVFVESYYADKCSWSQFCEKVPRSFISYLTAWESLQSKLLRLRPDLNASERIDLMEDMRQITYYYEFKKPTPGWVRVPKERWKTWLTPFEKQVSQTTVE